MYQHSFKRILDVVLSGLALLVLLLPMVIVAVVIVLDDGGSPFFSQRRVGLHKKEFRLYKFRSMKRSTPHDVPTHLLENPEQYFLRCGRLIRRLSIDELPQLWNIFKGDMSIVGPRPALWNQTDLIAERERYGANDVLPGLTGWAQINGRDELAIPVKAKLDGDYARNISFAFDCRCVLGTVAKVLKSEGVVEGAAPATEGKEEELTVSVE